MTNEQRVCLRLARIKAYRESGTTVGGHDVDWLLRQLDEAQKRADRQRVWIDGVMRQNPAGYWHFDLPGGFTKNDLIGARPLIIRPTQFEDKP